MPVDENYRKLLRSAVAAAGGQRAVADKIGVHQSTISRTLDIGKDATYTTLLKLSQALPNVPPPTVPVRDEAHERWCRIGLLLAEHKPDSFASLLNLAEDAVRMLRPSDAQVDRVRELVADPIPRRTRKRIAGR